ncbi:C-C motif chemokine 2 [Pygocentrus nattereri]|uniref:C-C motif chemokine 2 n=1 Tax=Pygocentrus nattereri TaxID=42514 RepID=UPI000814254A|nr:C-C motif chemokine 2 [Pygocentrus nattereri]
MKLPLVLRCSAAVLVLLLLSKQGSEARPPVGCCMKTSERKVYVDQLSKYTIQNKPLCPVYAVRFITQRGNLLCSDPSSPWAVRAMAYLDKKNNPQPTKLVRMAHQTTSLPPVMQSNSTTTNGTFLA